MPTLMTGTDWLPLGGTGSRALGWWGMTWLIATEAALFAYLLFAYFYLASAAQTRWPPSGPPELSLALPNTFVLLASSAALLWAERGMDRDRPGRLRLGLAVTILLGAAFLVVQGFEYHRAAFSPSTDAYGSLFFTITGLHGAHVLVGLLMNAFALAMALAGPLTRARRVAIHNAALYWHFVDVVWLVVFTCLYLSPRMA